MKYLLSLGFSLIAISSMAQIPYSSQVTEENKQLDTSEFTPKHWSMSDAISSKRSISNDALDNMYILKPKTTDAEMVLWMPSPERMPNLFARKEP